MDNLEAIFWGFVFFYLTISASNFRSISRVIWVNMTAVMKK